LIKLSNFFKFGLKLKRLLVRELCDFIRVPNFKKFFFKCEFGVTFDFAALVWAINVYFHDSVNYM